MADALNRCTEVGLLKGISSQTLLSSLCGAEVFLTFVTGHINLFSTTLLRF